MYTRAQAIEFWYEYDQRFLFASPPEVNDAYAIAFPDGQIDVLVDIVRDAAGGALLPAIAPRAAGLRTLARLQLELMDRFFPDPADLQRAFEDFGQGVLLDSPQRRPPTRLIHMMDGEPDNWVGYHRWHAFARCAEVLDGMLGPGTGSGASPSRWTTVSQFVALAWAIQSEAAPQVDDPGNPGLPEARLEVLRAGWLGLDAASRDAAFLNYTGHFGQADFAGSVRAPAIADFYYSRVTQLLARAADPSHPSHSGAGRFWAAPEAQFVRLIVYGHPLVAAPGPARGGRSALVRSLRGELAGFPRMPRNRPPLPPADIALIERWIDLLAILRPEVEVMVGAALVGDSMRG